MIAFAASFLSAGTACLLERLIWIFGTDPGLRSPEGTHRDLDQCLCQQCNLWRHSFFMALHDEPDHLCSAGAAGSIATSRRPSLGRWVSQTFTIFLNSISIQNHIALLMMPAASGYSSTATLRRQSLGRWVSQTFTIFLNSISNPEPHRIAHDAYCLWLLIDCNFPLAIVGRRDSQDFHLL